MTSRDRDGLEFFLLGGVDARRDGMTVDIGPPQRRAVLAALLIDAGRSVTVDTLTGRVWGDDVPGGSRSALYAHVHRLRTALWPAGTSRLIRRAASYVLDMPGDRVDLLRFEQLCQAARQPGLTPDGEDALLRNALREWRGAPLDGIAGSWAEAIRVRTDSRRLDAVARWSVLALQRGDVRAVTEQLPAYLADYPLSEQLMAQLMQALHREERPAEAVDWFARFRARLADELGVDPGPELQRIHATVLRAADDAEPAAPVVPAQLPPVVARFVGRSPELRRLDEAVARRRRLGAPAVAVICGSAGVGKTTLAVRWAGQVRERFPDGQLYLDLHGFDADQPTDPGAALATLLVALGTHPGDLPAGSDARAALYRSALSDRRMLIVLDNARDAAQVRPLLPPSAGAFTVVTSRNRLTSLAATGETVLVLLDVFPLRQARQMLAERIGAGRMLAGGPSAERIVVACAGLPLALAIAAARVQESDFALGELADELSDEHARLDALDTGDPAGQVRAVFSWSYHALTDESRRLFHLVGIHPGPDLTTASMAALAGADEREVRQLLRTLGRAALLSERFPGRYVCHSLLRSYAAELAVEQESDDDRQAALRRLVDHYVATAYSAAKQLAPGKCELPPQFAVRDVAVADPAGWLAAELPVVLAGARVARELGLDRQVWQLAWVLNTYLHRIGHWAELRELGQAALAAARRLEDQLAVAHAHRIIADAEALLARFDEAAEHLRLSLPAYRELGQLRYHADVHLQLAVVAGYRGDNVGALPFARQALTLYRQGGFTMGCARALNTLGWFELEAGDFAGGVATSREALQLFRELNDLEGEAATWDTLGCAQLGLGHHAEAQRSLDQAAVLAREAGDRFLEAAVLDHLGDARRSGGEQAGAREAWQRALEIFERLHHGYIECVRDKIALLDAA